MCQVLLALWAWVAARGISYSQALLLGAITLGSKKMSGEGLGLAVTPQLRGSAWLLGLACVPEQVLIHAQA